MSRTISLVAPLVTDADRRYLCEAIEQGAAESDAEVMKLETAFTSLLGTNGSVATGSGLAALHLALHAVGVRSADEVIVPSYTCVALLHAVELCGATAVFADNSCDVRTADYHVGIRDVKRKCSKRTRAIVVSHMFGTVLPLDEILATGIPVVEDFTLSLGAYDHARPAGSMGTVAVSSLHHSKMISAGQGGIVTTSDEALLDRVRTLCEYDRMMASWRFGARDLTGAYDLAFSYRMGSLQAALANSQLAQLDAFIARRREIASLYTSRFESGGILCPEVPPGRANVFFRYLIRSPAPVVELLERLRARGIEAGRGVFPALHTLKGIHDDDFPGARDAVRNLVSIPVHPGLSDDDVEYVTSEVAAAIKA